MTKKFVVSSFVLLLFVVSAMPAWAGMTISEVNLVGQFNGQWPDFNGFAWSVAGSSNGKQPKAVTVNDPNQLPSYATDYGPGTIRVFYTPVDGGSNTQTFSTDGNTDGFALTRIAVRVSGGGSDQIDQNSPFTVHIYDVCDIYGQIPPDWGQIIPANCRPYGGTLDFLSGPAFAVDPCFAAVGSWDWDILLALDFNEYDRVDLEPNHTYAFEIWGPTGWDSAPPYVFGMVWNALENTGPAGCGYQVAGSADNGNGPGASNLTNPRGMSLGSTDQDFVVGVYGDYADGNAYHPEPRKYQTEVSMTPTLTWHPGKWAKDHQVWFSTDWSAVAKRLSAANKGRVQDPCYTPPGLALNTMYYWRVDEYNDQNTVPVPKPDANYFWGVAKNITGDFTDRYTIYNFRTISPSASNPSPVSAFVPQIAVFKVQSAWLQWTAGALANNDSAGHQVYFGTNWNDVNDANTNDDSFREAVTDPCYPLENLYPDYSLTSGATFYWRVDEVNTPLATTWKGPVWSFRMASPASITVEDFSSSADFATYWKTHYKLPGVNPTYSRVGGVISLVSNSLELIYNNSGKPSGDPNGPWSEAMLDYNNTNGMDWTLGGVFEPVAIGVLFDGTIGNTLNSNDANYDKMYLGIEDAQGNLGIVYYPDVYAAQRAISIAAGNTGTREFKVALTDLTSPNNVDLTEVNRVFVGIGSPRGSLAGLTGNKGGTGTLRYDNIRIYVQHCNPTYPQTSMVSGDLAGPLVGTPTTYHSRWTAPDCIVNLHDIYYLASDWLFAEPNLSYGGTMSDPGTSALTVYYKFDESSGTAIADSSGHGRNGTLSNLSSVFTWAYKGHDDVNHCVNLEPGYKTWIECPTSIIAGTADTGQTFTFWLNYDERFRPAHEWASVLVFHSTAPGAGYAQTIEDQLPAQPFTGGTNSPWLRWVDMRVSDETGLQGASGSRPSMIWGRWNHYALVYDTNVDDVNGQMRMYVNGKLICGDTSASYTTPWGPSETGDGNANTVRIGTRSNLADPTTDPGTSGSGEGGGFWQGKIDDMRLYSKALSVGEVQYLATDGTGSRDMQTIFIELDNYNDGTVTSTYLGGQPVQIINFQDFAQLANYWLLNGQQYELWP